MPMIDVYAVAGTLSDKHGLAQNLANAVMRWERSRRLISSRATPQPSFMNYQQNRFRRGESNYVRVQVLTPVGVLDREKQLGVVREQTDIVVAAAKDPTLSTRTWVLITESPEGGWGINGHANTSADIVAAASDAECCEIKCGSLRILGKT